MAAELRSETNWRRSRFTGNEDDDYHEYRTPLLDLVNDKYRIRSIQTCSRRHQLFPMATIDHWTPEKLRLYP